MDIKKNISFFQTTAGARNARLIAVTKNQAAEKIQQAYDAGQRIFGENKVQEMAEKHAVLPSDIEWHMIGHLQTNKVKYIAPFVALIHSVDSLKLLTEIDRHAKKNNRVIPCLLQVHIANEETKFGWDTDDLREEMHKNSFAGFSSIQIKGLMGMASLTEDEIKIRNEFRRLKNTFDLFRQYPISGNVEMKELSMGMSSDYKIALEEGSTLIRVGSAIFGQR
jgi:pyridoxal phosphate enzyme (YggS family)